MAAACSSWLRHGFIPARPRGLARAGRAGVAVDVGSVVFREFGHRGLQDRRARDPEAAEGELAQVVGELVEPREVVGAAEVRVDPFEDALDALRPHTTGHADATGLLRQIVEEPRRLVHDADVRADDPDLRRAEVRAGGLQGLVVEGHAGPRRVEDAARRSADVETLELLPGGAAGPFENVAERRAEGDLVHAGRRDGTRDRYELRAGRRGR